MKRGLLFCFLLCACASSGPEAEEGGVPPAAETPASFKAPGDHTPEEIHAKLLPLAAESAKKVPFSPTATEFTVMLSPGPTAALPPEKVSDSAKAVGWPSSSVQVLSRDRKTVDQISLFVRTCQVSAEKLDAAELNKRLQSLVGLVSQNLFGMPFLLSSKYFTDVSPQWNQQIRIPIRQEYLPVVDMRIIRGPQKCDGVDGFGYRFDFFMK